MPVNSEPPLSVDYYCTIDQVELVLYVLTPADSKRVYSRRIFIVMDIISSNFVVEGYFVVIGSSVCNLLIVMQFGFICAVIHP